MDEQRLERELRVGLAELLDPVTGSHPDWAASPAAERVAAASVRPWRSLNSGLFWAALLGLLFTALLASALFVGGQRSEDAGPSAWTTIEFPEGGAVIDVIETPTGYLAVGWGPHTDRGSDGVVWASPDCLQWERLPTPVELAGRDRRGRADALPDPGPTEIEFAGGLYLAAGGDIGPEVVLWLSPSGRDWERVVPEVVPTDRPGRALEMNDLIAFAGHFVAIGGWGGSDPMTPSFWISSDGRSWREVTEVEPPPAGLASRDGENPWGWAMFDLGSALAASESELFAAGTSGRGEAVWRSTDGGSTWTRVLGDDQATFRVLWDIAVSPDGVIVAVGNGPFGGEPVVWWSPDGTTWSMVTDMEAFAAPPTPADYHGVVWLAPEVSLDSIDWAGGRFVVLGNEGGSGAAIPVVWTSTDGRTWTREVPGPAFEEGLATGAATCGDHVLLYGGDFGTAAGWTRPIDSFEAAGPQSE